MIDNYTCDGCSLPFTAEEWDARETPHHVDCPNYDPDDGDTLGDEKFVECTCDRNYHSGCFDFNRDPEMKNSWVCCDCGESVDPQDVTYEETHDPRSGGCGGQCE